jgi:hypothetical protein
MTCLGQVRGTISQLRVMSTSILQLSILAIICESGYVNPLNPTYVYYDDGETWIRKGVRDGYFIVDIRLTASPGWDGTEDIDWQELRTLMKD